MDVFLPAAERVEVIRLYAREFEIYTFVETGTSSGETTAALMDDFHSIITIELDPFLFRQAEERFRLAHVKCILGDSGTELANVVALLKEPAVFWLDGHYCGPGSARGQTDTPVAAELNAAVCAPGGSVILIDDARLFGGMPEHTEEFRDYPHVDWVQRVAAVCELEFELKDDIMRLTPRR